MADDGMEVVDRMRAPWLAYQLKISKERGENEKLDRSPDNIMEEMFSIARPWHHMLVDMGRRVRDMRLGE